MPLLSFLGIVLACLTGTILVLMLFIYKIKNNDADMALVLKPNHDMLEKTCALCVKVVVLILVAILIRTASNMEDAIYPYFSAYVFGIGLGVVLMAVNKANKRMGETSV